MDYALLESKACSGLHDALTRDGLSSPREQRPLWLCNADQALHYSVSSVNSQIIQDRIRLENLFRYAGKTHATGYFMEGTRVPQHHKSYERALHSNTLSCVNKNRSLTLITIPFFKLCLKSAYQGCVAISYFFRHNKSPNQNTKNNLGKSNVIRSLINFSEHVFFFF